MNPTSFVMSNLVSSLGMDHPRQIRNHPPPLKNPKLSHTTNASMNEIVLGFFINDVPVAVPLSVAENHKVIQIKNKGRWVSLTYCPLTRSGVIFYNLWGTTGLLYNSNIVLFSENDGLSLMPQLLGRIINGVNFNQLVPKIRVYQTSRYGWERVFPNTLYIQGNSTNKYDSYDVSPHLPQFPLMHLPPSIPGKGPKNIVVGFNLNGNNYCVFDTDILPNQPLYIRNIDNITVYGSVKAPNSIKIQRDPTGSIEILYEDRPINAIECYFFAWYATFPDTYIVGVNLDFTTDIEELYPWINDY